MSSLWQWQCQKWHYPEYQLPKESWHHWTTQKEELNCLIVPSHCFHLEVWSPQTSRSWKISFSFKQKTSFLVRMVVLLCHHDPWCRILMDRCPRCCGKPHILTSTNKADLLKVIQEKIKMLHGTLGTHPLSKVHMNCYLIQCPYIHDHTQYLVCTK